MAKSQNKPESGARPFRRSASTSAGTSTQTDGKKLRNPNSETPSRGRPLTYRQEIADEICKRMAHGESLRSICRDPKMPPDATVRGWVLDDWNGFAAQYTRARMLQAERWAEEVLEIADDSSRDVAENDHGDNVTNHENIQRSRLRVDSRKWLLSKVLPKIYGDKLDLVHQGGVKLEVVTGVPDESN